ncbi:MAG: YqeG family HAD IIIA-type phosphatase [Clostridia bacterium]|nr:YqeG family HAD IIIA-type phosphatase [Clostridia bacterium]
MKNIFLPEVFVDTVFDIDLQDLSQNGVKAFIFDIDNTLATYAMPLPDEKTAEWIKMLKDKGFGVFFASNNDEERVKTFAESVDVPYKAKALKPLGKYLKKACKLMGVSPGETALVGDQLFTDIWGGNWLRMYTILVNPISEVEDSFVRFKRRFEKMILKNYR